MATTTFRRDYLQRKIVNPGTAAVDYLGRATTATVDSSGRLLYGTDYANSGVYTLGQYVQLASGVLLQCTVAGTSAAGAPTAPGYGNTVVSGGATFLQVTTT